MFVGAFAEAADVTGRARDVEAYDGVETAVGAGPGGVCRSGDADEGALESGGEVKRPGIVADNDGGTLNHGREKTKVGAAGNVGRLRRTQRSDALTNLALVRAAHQHGLNAGIGGDSVNDGGESIRGPLLGVPPGAGEDGGERLVPPHAGLADEVGRRGAFGVRDGQVEDLGQIVESKGAGHGPVAIHRVRLARPRRKAIGMEDPGEFPSRIEPQTDRGARAPGKEPTAEQSLEVDDEVESVRAQIAQEASQRASGLRAVSSAGVKAAVELDRLVELRVTREQRNEGTSEEPGNAGVGIPNAQPVQNGQRVDDVAERTGLDDEDALEAASAQAVGSVARDESDSQSARGIHWLAASRTSAGQKRAL